MEYFKSLDVIIQAAVITGVFVLIAAFLPLMPDKKEPSNNVSILNHFFGGIFNTNTITINGIDDTNKK